MSKYKWQHESVKMKTKRANHALEHDLILELIEADRLGHIRNHAIVAAVHEALDIHRARGRERRCVGQ